MLEIPAIFHCNALLPTAVLLELALDVLNSSLLVVLSEEVKDTTGELAVVIFFTETLVTVPLKSVVGVMVSWAVEVVVGPKVVVVLEDIPVVCPPIERAILPAVRPVVVT